MTKTKRLVTNKLQSPFRQPSESEEQVEARYECHYRLGQHANWRNGRSCLHKLLDPNWKHPKTKKNIP